MNVANRSDVRLIRNVEAPRPLKSSSAVVQNVNTSCSFTNDSIDYVLKLMDSVTSSIISHKYDDDLTSNIMLLHRSLKVYGSKLEDTVYQSELNDAFSVFRKCLVTNDLEYQARVNLLEIIELRDRQWSVQDVISPYHTSRFLYNTENVDSQLQERVNSNLSGNSAKLSKSSGIVGKNYLKGDMIIKNSDSGKVQPTAKDRQVQITGQTEDNIVYATQLIQDTIRSNTSPEPSTSINDNDNNPNYSYNMHTEININDNTFNTINDSKMMKTPQYNYRHKVMVKNNQILITGNNYLLVTKAKSVLDDYFSKNAKDLQSDDAVFHDLISSTDNEGEKELLHQQWEKDDGVEQVNQLVLNNGQPMQMSRKSSTIDKAGITYTMQDMLNLRHLPLSNDTPSNWHNIFRNYTNAPFIKSNQLLN